MSGPAAERERTGAGGKRGTARWGLVWLTVVLLASTAFAQERTRPGKRNFLWKVRSETATVYLLGSIHLLKPDMYPLDRGIEEAFDRSSVLVVESDVKAADGGERQRRMLQGAMYPPGDSLENHLSAETLDLLRRRFPELKPERVNRFRPWALAMTIAVLEYRKLGLNYEYGIDMYFLGKAASGKRIREIEPDGYVIDMLNGFSDEHQDHFLLYTLLDLDRVREKSDLILEAWTGGDAAALERILSESLREYPRLLPVFEELFFRRNENMAAKIEGYLREKEAVFVVVGAGHLVGEKGIVELLRKKGFPVEQQ